MLFISRFLTNKYLLLISLIFSTSLLIAQTEFRPGFIITTTNDTIYGEIDFRRDKFMAEQCRFKNGNGEITSFSPEDLSGYRILESKFFVTRTINGRKEFLEYLINGQINIYYKYDSTGTHYYLEKAGLGIVEIPYREQYVNKNGLVYLKKSKDHIGLLNYYMMDAPELQSRISKIDAPEHSNLINLAEDYHNKVCKDQECIIYEKQMHSFKLDIELQGGINNIFGKGPVYQYYKDHNISTSYSQATGLIFHISSPQLSEKYTLRTGVQYSRYFDLNQDYSGTYGIFTIPVGIEYLRPKGFIRPSYMIGMNIMTIPKNYIFDFSVGAGLNFKITNSLSLGLNYNMDIFPSFFFMGAFSPFDKHSLLAGLRIKL